MDEGLSLVELKKELKRVRQKAQVAEDKDVRAALSLRAEQLEKEVEALEEAEAAELQSGTPSATEEEPEEELAGEPSPEQIELAERYIREARLEKSRGNKQRAIDLLRMAAEAAPGSASVLEALGDDLLERRQIREATKVYAKAKALAPNNVGLERKHAQAVLIALGAGSIEDQLRRSFDDTPFVDPSEVMASARAATLLTLFVPGSGHFVLGRTREGFVYFFTWLVAVFFVFLMKDDVAKLIKMAGGAGAHPNLVVLLPMFVAVIIHIAALFGCATRMKSPQQRAKSVDRPAPPVNLPFD